MEIENLMSLADRVRNTEANAGEEYSILSRMVRETIRSQFECADVDSMYEDYQHGIDDDFTMCSVQQLWEGSFLKLPVEFRGTCRTLADFDRRYGLTYNDPKRECSSPADLMGYCEYVMTLTRLIEKFWQRRMGAIPSRIYEHVGILVDKFGCTGRFVGMFYRVVPCDEVTKIAIEASPSSLSDKIYMYRHKEWRGHMDLKSDALNSMYIHLEPHRNELKEQAKVLEDCFFGAANKLGLRHNNVDPTKGSYNSRFAELAEYEIESLYDRMFSVGVVLVAILSLKEDREMLNSYSGIKR